jgi:hypothetical protein
MKRGRILSHHRDIHSLWAPGKSGMAKGRGIPSPSHPLPPPSFSTFVGENPQVARGDGH